MQRTGLARLPLHCGKAPSWLTSRMRKLAREIVTIIIDEHGSGDFLKRLSDPFWFQALGCVLGYDWHSSGVTTVVTAVLKNSVDPASHNIAVCGGKGKISTQTPSEIGNLSETFGFSKDQVERMQYASRMSAKVDSAAIQAGYQLYHHAFFADKNGEWAVIQQGMCPDDRTARRYHWLSEKTGCFVVEPHNAIVGDAKREVALDMTARDSEECRKASLDIAKETPKRTMRLVMTLRPLEQKSLQEWIPDASQKSLHAHLIGSLSMPRNMNWKALEKVYEFQPRSYEDLLGFRGVGPATVRGLALIAELIYGKEPSWKDPVKYSFAYGGKDDVPHPVDRKAMDESVLVLRQAIIQARLGQKERLYSLRRLRRFVPADML